MEYHFIKDQNTFEIKLDTYSFSYTINGQENTISYAQVNNVRMSFPRNHNDKKLYSCTLDITDGPTIKIDSFNSKKGEYESKFNHYNQFIRVLHIHLMSKSKAKFNYGMSLKKALIISTLIVGILVLSYPVSQLLAQHSVFIFTTVPVIVGYLIYRIISRRPVAYSPEVIPYHILPSSSS